jgi:hypothetical protein
VLALASREIHLEMNKAWGWRAELAATLVRSPLVIAERGTRGKVGAFEELRDELEAPDSRLPEDMLDPRRFPEQFAVVLITCNELAYGVFASPVIPPASIQILLCKCRLYDRIKSGAKRYALLCSP